MRKIQRNTRALVFNELVTPGIIKYPFWRLTAENPEATYACLNQGEAYAPGEIRKRAICMDGDIGEVLLKIVNPIEKSVPNNI